MEGLSGAPAIELKASRGHPNAPKKAAGQRFFSREMQHFPKAHLCTDRLSGGRLGAGRLSGGHPRNLRSGRLGRSLRSGRLVVVFTVASGVAVSVVVVSVVDVSVVVVSVVVVTVSRGLMTKSCVPFFTHCMQHNCMAWRASLAPRPATGGPLVATPARPRGRLGQRGLEPESLRNRGISVRNADVCTAPARLRGFMTKSCVQFCYPPHAAKLHGTEGCSGASASVRGSPRGRPGAAQRALGTAWAGARRSPPKVQGVGLRLGPLVLPL